MWWSFFFLRIWKLWKRRHWWMGFQLLWGNVVRIPGLLEHLGIVSSQCICLAVWIWIKRVWRGTMRIQVKFRFPIGITFSLLLFLGALCGILSRCASFNCAIVVSILSCWWMDCSVDEQIETFIWIMGLSFSLNTFLHTNWCAACIHLLWLLNLLWAVENVLVRTI